MACLRAWAVEWAAAWAVWTTNPETFGAKPTSCLAKAINNSRARKGPAVLLSIYWVRFDYLLGVAAAHRKPAFVAELPLSFTFTPVSYSVDILKDR